MEALKNPDTVTMSVGTADGRWTTIPCKVTPVGWDRAKITANYMSTGTPVVRAVITIGPTPFAQTKIPKGSVRYAAGPVELGGTF